VYGSADATEGKARKAIKQKTIVHCTDIRITGSSPYWLVSASVDNK